MIYKYFLILIFFSEIIYPQDVKTDSSSFKSGLVYGKDHAFFVKAPSGWILDNSSGVSNGLFAVFYPEGGSWKYSPTVMYVNTVHKDSLNETYSEFITNDTSEFRKNYPGILISELPDIKTCDDKKAKVLYFKYSNYDAVAYIDEPKIVAMIVLTSRYENGFNESYPKFKELVYSYSFYTSNVEFDK